MTALTSLPTAFGVANMNTAMNLALEQKLTVEEVEFRISVSADTGKLLAAGLTIWDSENGDQCFSSITGKMETFATVLDHVLCVREIQLGARIPEQSARSRERRISL